MTNLDWIVSGTLIGAVVFVSICAFVTGVPSRIPLGKRVGPVNFDFSKSFASTVTALGALLATVLASKGTVTVSHPHLDSASYAALSLFFGILVVIAPFTYRALSATTDVKNDKGVADIQSQGYAGSFLLSTVLTVWAVLGQLVTLFFLLTDLQESTVFEGALFAVLIPSAILVGVYVWGTVPAVLHISGDTAIAQTMLRAQMRVNRIADSDTVDVGEPLTPWHPL
jgi:hypothetical protein